MSEKPHKNFLKIAVSVLALAAVVAGTAIWYYKSLPHRLQAVEPGVLYRSALLRPANLAKVLKENQIRTVVNLLPRDTAERTKELDTEARICRENDVAFVDIPMPAETPPTPAQLSQWLSMLDNKAEQPILVHCKHGTIRTGMMVAVYQIEYQKKKNGDVLEQLPMFGHDLYKPKRKPMREFILNYAPRSKRDEPPAPTPSK